MENALWSGGTAQLRYGRIFTGPHVTWERVKQKPLLREETFGEGLSGRRCSEQAHMKSQLNLAFMSNSRSMKSRQPSRDAWSWLESDNFEIFYFSFFFIIIWTFTRGPISPRKKKKGNNSGMTMVFSVYNVASHSYYFATLLKNEECKHTCKKKKYSDDFPLA